MKYSARGQMERFPKVSVRGIRNEVFKQRTSARIILTKWSIRLKEQIVDPGKTTEYLIDLVGDLAFEEMADRKYLIIESNGSNQFFRPLLL